MTFQHYYNKLLDIAKTLEYTVDTDTNRAWYRSVVKTKRKTIVLGTYGIGCNKARQYCILAAFAHELGHVLDVKGSKWYDKRGWLIYNYGDMSNASKRDRKIYCIHEKRASLALLHLFTDFKTQKNVVRVHNTALRTYLNGYKYQIKLKPITAYKEAINHESNL